MKNLTKSAWFAIFLWLATLNIINAQCINHINWKKTIGGNGDDVLFSVTSTSDGGYIAAGGTTSSDGDVGEIKSYNRGFTSDMWVVKFDAQGHVEWSRVYGGSNNEVANSVIQTNDGGYLVAGYTKSSTLELPYLGDVTYNDHGNPRLIWNEECWIIKLNAKGEKEWDKSFGGTGNERISSIVQTRDMGYIFCAYTNSVNGDITLNNHGGYDYWIVKLKPNGDKEWDEIYGGSKDDIPRSIIETDDGGYAIAGTTFSNDGNVTKNHGASDIWILRLSINRTKMWDLSLGGFDKDYGKSIVQTMDGTYYIGATTASFTHNGNSLTDFFVTKLDNSEDWGKAPNIEWSKNYGGSDNEECQKIIPTADGGCIAIGSTMSDNGDVKFNHRAGSFDYWIAKISGKGVLENQQSFGGAKEDQLYSITQLKDRSLILAGFTKSNDGDIDFTYMNNGQSFADGWIIKLDAFSGADVNLGPNGFRPLGYQLHPNEVNLNADVNTNAGNYEFIWQDGSKVPTYKITELCSQAYEVFAKNMQTGCINSSTAIFRGFNQDNRSYGGNAEDKLYSGIKTFDGGYIMVGYTTSPTGSGDISFNHGKKDMWIVKTDAVGNKEWEKSCGGDGDEEGHSIVQTEDGGYIIAGYTTSAPHFQGLNNGIAVNGDVHFNHANGVADIWVVKLDNTANLNHPPAIEWENSYGGSNADEGNSIVESRDNRGNVIGYAVTGYTRSNDGDVFTRSNQGGNNGTKDMWLVQIDLKGKLLGEIAYGGSKDDEANSIIQTTDGGYMVAGYTTSNDGDVAKQNHGDNSGTQDMWLYKLDQNLNPVWNKCYGSGDEDYAQSITQTKDGGYIVAANAIIEVPATVTNSPQKYSWNKWIVKISDKGEVEWDKVYGDVWTKANSITQTKDGGYLVGGYASIADPKTGIRDINYDILKIRADYTSPDGNLIHGEISWQNQIGGNNYDEAINIIEDPKNRGAYTLIGYSCSNEGRGGINIKDHHGPIDPQNADYWMIQIITCPEDEPKEKTHKEKEAISQINSNTKAQIFPNPFIQKAILKLNNVPDNKKYTLVISDMYGRQVRQINNITTQTIEIKRANLSAGIYQYQLLDNKSLAVTGKMVIE